jgi:short-subunit dehydrogenase
MKTALITGASLGIGLEFARVFAKEKNNLVLVARSKDKLEVLAGELRKDFDVTVKVIAADLSDMNAVQNVYDTCKKEGIEIEYLINNAGFGRFGFFAEDDWEKTGQMIDLNIKALTKFCRMFLPDMIARKSGKILNVASTAAFQPGPVMAVYCASKSYVLSFSEALHNETNGTGVSVTCLCPGATESNFQVAAAMEDSALFNTKKIPSSAEVAIFGYKAMMKNKMTVVHGFMNFLLTSAVRFSPRILVPIIARKVIGEPGRN